jgi:hypothetical protein
MAETLGEVPSKESPAPLIKKSLFKRPAWSRADIEDDLEEEGVDFFSRAKDLYPMRVAEEERKRQKKLEKTEKLERKRSSASAERKYPRTPELKRRRISSQADGHSSDISPDVDDGHESTWNRRFAQAGDVN